MGRDNEISEERIVRMGTSKGYIAPTTVKWAQAKRAVSTYLKDNDSNSRTNAVGRFAEAMRDNVSSGMSSSFQSSATKLLGFAQSVASGGLNNALQDIGREDLIGKSTDEIWSELMHDFTNAGASTEDALAADALSSALDNLQIDELTQLGALSPEVLLKEFLTEYIISFFDFTFEERISKGITPQEKEARLEDIHNYIKNSLDTDLNLEQIKTVDFSHLEGAKVVQSALDDALSVFIRYYEAV